MPQEKEPVVISSGWVIPIGTAAIITGALFTGYLWLDSKIDCLNNRMNGIEQEISSINRDVWYYYDQQWYTRNLKAKLKSSDRGELADCVPDVGERMEGRGR